MNEKLKKAREEYMKIPKSERMKRWNEFLNSEDILTEQQVEEMRKELDILRGRA